MCVRACAYMTIFNISPAVTKISSLNEGMVYPQCNFRIKRARLKEVTLPIPL